ncbi:spermine oxidase isoform X1 [Stomoxys calcitrans]|uniref:spermine oxidase isoform X1 n=2 Tax=Stomoxys calcitrans TaxID=35570 RepID=UPI0027E39E99|nr:spermine oxidase isoform X1 [Stomoxys calcitrans]
MDLKQCEEEARQAALKDIINMFQRPDQLEKLEQYRQRVARQKASVEALLKSGLQNQLDGVRVGLEQLKTCLQDVREFKRSMGVVEQLMQGVPELYEALQDVRKENIKYSQLATAVKNLGLIYNVEASVQQTMTLIEEDNLLYAHQSLTELENARDDLLDELHMQPKQHVSDKITFKRHFEKFDTVSQALEKKLRFILSRTLETVRKEPQIIVTALRIVEREEKSDQFALQQQKVTSFLPPGRPRQWRAMAMNVLKEAVVTRIESSNREEREDNKMWLVRVLEILRQNILVDLRVVKSLCVPCFPPHYNIFEEYVKMYHESLSNYITLPAWISSLNKFQRPLLRVLFSTSSRVHSYTSSARQLYQLEMSSPKIVIVGSGASGIACATKLLDYGFDNVVIVEAESRIGGRIHTIPFADNVIDLGAQWCHGEKDNMVYELAHKHDLLDSTGDVYESYQCVRSNREVVPEDISQRLKDIVNDSLVTRQMELRNCQGSLGSYLNNKFYEALRRPENSDIDMAIAKEFFENYKKFENSVEASDTLDDVSGKGYLEYWECEGDILLNWKDKGYVEFLRLLMRSRELKTEWGVLEKRVLLNKKVTRIEWSRNDCCVQIRCADGDCFVADHVILTVSLGVLKEQQLMLFDPKLPVEKQRAIDGLAFGTVNKIFIEFPQQFWPDKWTGFTMLWRDEDIADIRGTPRAWLEDVFGFYCDHNQPRLLSGWMIGANGRHMETLPEDEILAGCMYLFRKFLQWDIPEPCNFKTSTWYTNENFRGSYSFRSMYTEEVGTSARELAQPLHVVTTKPVLNGEPTVEPLYNQSRCDKPIVQFAGEATSDHYFSTVHGAVEAGWREATRLADFYGMLRNSHKLPKSNL